MTDEMRDRTAAADVSQAQARRNAASVEGRADRVSVSRAAHDGFLALGEGSLRTRVADDRDAEMARLKRRSAT